MEYNKLLEKKSKADIVVCDSSKAELLDVSGNSNTVDIVLNTYLYIDKGGDMLLPGCSLKSITDHGPEAQNKKPKIKFCKDHMLCTDTPGFFTKLQESEINGEQKLWGSVEFYKDEIGMGLYERYLKGGIDQHSIGFKYMSILLATKERVESPNLPYQPFDIWVKYLPLAINPEVAEKAGYFYVVPEIRLFEGSAVAYGMNDKTEVLGVKSLAGARANLIMKIDTLQKALTNNKSDDFMFWANLQINMLKNDIENFFAPVEKPSPDFKVEKPKQYISNFIVDNFKL